MCNFIKNLSLQQSETKKFLGENLAKNVFDNSHHKIINKLGLLSQLLGPGKELWISPSDELVEKTLKSPVYTDCVKAYTHDAIIVIGEQALEKYRQEAEERIREKLNENLSEERHLYKAEKRRAVELSLQKYRERYKKCVLDMKLRFRQKLENELNDVFAECKKKMEEAILKERASLTGEMLKKMRNEICFVVINLYHHFELEHYAQKKNMNAQFNMIMRRDRLKSDAAIKEIIRKKEEEFRIKLHELELQKIVDLTYVLCSERLRCSSEKHEIHEYFEKKIEVLQKMLLEANRVIKLLKEQSCENNIDDKVWETKLMEIIKQFQKFINFAFGAMPGQAEFFLSLESLLALELNEKFVEKDEKKEKKIEDLKESEIFKVVEIIDKCGRKWRPIQLIPDFQQLTTTQNQEKLGDRKNCKIPAINGSFRSLHSMNSLSFCHFENTFYYRADFQEGDIENETKTMIELAEDARFIVDLKKVEASDLILNQGNETETLWTQDKNFEITKNQTSKSCLSDNLVENLKSHNKMIKSITEKNQDGKKIFKILGDDDLEHSQTLEQFTIARMQSLTRIFKLHPSLRQILIPPIGKALY